MKNNEKSLIKRIKNTNYNFSKNFFYHLIVPCIAILVGIILLFTVGVNKGIDFAGGTTATVVVENIEKDNNYSKAKEKLDTVLNNYKISGEVYQLVETNRYGYAISVSFENIDCEELELFREDLKDKLANAFYPNLTNEDELNNFIKVSTYGNNTSNSFIVSSALALLCAVVAAFIYVAIRFGLSAGITSLSIAILDILATLGWVLITRVNVESTVMIALMFTCVYSMLASVLFFSKVKSNLAKEKYAKASNIVLANQSVKQTILTNTLLLILFLVSALLLGAIPTYMVRRMSIPVMIGGFVVYYSSTLLTPGLWALTHIRKTKKQKQVKEKEVQVAEEEQFRELEDAPEVIVETEAKEN